MTLSITTILKIWGTLMMTIIITINREFQYDFEYECGSFWKNDIIKRVNIVATMENTMILT